MGLTEQAGEQRNEDQANQRDAAARHELLHALGLGTRVIIAVALEEVDRAPNGEAGTQSDDEGLKDINGRVKEIHNIVAGISFEKMK